MIIRIAVGMLQIFYLLLELYFCSNVGRVSKAVVFSEISKHPVEITGESI